MIFYFILIVVAMVANVLILTSDKPLIRGLALSVVVTLSVWATYEISRRNYSNCYNYEWKVPKHQEATWKP